MSVDQIHQLTAIDTWFLHKLQRITQLEQHLANHKRYYENHSKYGLKAQRFTKCLVFILAWEVTILGGFYYTIPFKIFPYIFRNDLDKGGVCLNSISNSLSVSKGLLLRAKQEGFSDRQLGLILGISEGAARQMRLRHGIRPWVKQVGDTRFLTGGSSTGSLIIILIIYLIIMRETGILKYDFVLLVSCF